MPRKPKRPCPSVDKSILAYFHCNLCIKEWQNGEAPGESPESYARLSVGFTEIGLQVWCVRHQCNVCHIDFEGEVHPANINRKAEPHG